MPEIQWISVLRRGLAAVAIASLLAGCSAIGEEDFTSPKGDWKSTKTFTSKNYPKKGDNDPHPGVARVHRLPVHGIDVSRWQANIDWVAVRGAGTRFAFIKATEGMDHIDPNFRQNWAGAGEAGVPRAAYHFMYWCSPAIDQANWYIRNVPRDPNGLPPVIDAEWVNKSRTCKRRVPANEALKMVKTVSAKLEKHYGKVPIIYTDINFHRDVLEGQPLDNTFWLRSTAAEPHVRYVERRWTLWQWTQTGTVPGIRGEVDRNAFYGTEREWAMFVSSGCDPRNSRLTSSGRCGAPGNDLLVARSTPSDSGTPPETMAAPVVTAAAEPMPVLPGVTDGALPQPTLAVASASDLPPLPKVNPALEAYAPETTGSVDLGAFITQIEAQ